MRTNIVLNDELVMHCACHQPAVSGTNRLCPAPCRWYSTDSAISVNTLKNPEKRVIIKNGGAVC